MSMQILRQSFEQGYYPHLVQMKDENDCTIPALRSFEKDCEKQGIAPDDRELKQAEKEWIVRLNVDERELNRMKQVKQLARRQWMMEAICEDAKVPIAGDEAVTGEKAFSLTSTLAIFPVFYDNQIQAGILAHSLLPLLVMDTITGNYGVFDHVTMNETASDRQFGEAGEYTTFREVYISGANAPITMHKFGSILHASDEALRRARVPIYQYGIQRIGMQMGIDLTDFAIDVLLNGDGTAGAAPVQASAVSHAATYLDWTQLLYKFPIGYEGFETDYIASALALTRLQVVPEIKDPLAGFMLQRDGGIPPLFGFQGHRWDSTGSTTYSNSGALDVVVLFKRGLSLIQYQEGGIVTESERVLSNEFVRTKSSISVSYGIWDRNAAVQGTGF